MASHLRKSCKRVSLGLLAFGSAALGFPGVAAADPPPDYIDGYVHSTDEYPVPRRILITTCSAEQLLDAAKYYQPMEFDRYIMEFKKHGEPLQEQAQDRIHWFFSMAPGVKGPRRDFSEHIAATFGDPLDILYTDYLKIFLNNKGVVAKMTDHCLDYPRNDQSAWDWRDDDAPVAYS